jgi:hypothetical protein
MIFYNPLTLGQSSPLKNPDRVFNYRLKASDMWLSTHRGRLKIPVVPAGAPLLFEEGIRGALIGSMPLTDESGLDSAAGTRISIPSSRSEFLRSGILVDDYWLISVPGAGTMLMHTLNNDWPLLRDTVVWVDLLKQNWRGSGQYDATRGPAEAGAEVIGLTGMFKELRGVGHDRLSLDSYAGNFDVVAGQLTIKSHVVND